MASITAAKNLMDPYADSAGMREYAKAMESMSSARILQDALGGINSLRDIAMGSSEASSARNIAEMFSGGAAMREYSKALDITGPAKKLAMSLGCDFAQREYAKVIESFSVARRLEQAFGATTAQQDLLKASASANWIQQLSKSMVDDDLYRRFLGTLNIGHSASYDLGPSTAEIAKQKYDRLFSTSNAWAGQLERLKRPEYLDTLLAGIERDVSAYADTAETFEEEDVGIEEAEVLLHQLAAAENPQRFAEILARVPQWFKWALVNFVMYVMLPTMIGLSVNLITPQVEQYLHHKPAATQREQIKDIKKLSMAELGVALRDYRFVTAQTLELRTKPNSKSDSLGKVEFGQVVGVISTRRDWTEIAYEYGDGQTVTGWVYARYTAKFRR